MVLNGIYRIMFLSNKVLSSGIILIYAPFIQRFVIPICSGADSLMIYLSPRINKISLISWVARETEGSSSPAPTQVPFKHRANQCSTVLHSTGETTPGVSCPVLDSSIEPRPGHPQQNPVRGCKDDWGTGPSLPWGRAKTAGTVQPEGWGRISSMCTSLWRDSVKKMESGFFSVVHWLDNGQWAQTETQEVYLNICKQFLL